MDALDILFDGLNLRDASLDEVEHYFIYTADAYAAMVLGGPRGDDGLRIAA